jgi:hypothetical protein
VKRENSNTIVIKRCIVINFDDDKIAKIYEEVHNELNVLFSKNMDLDGGNCDDPPDESDPPHVTPRDTHSTKLVVVSFSSCLPYMITKIGMWMTCFRLGHM